LYLEYAFCPENLNFDVMVRQCYMFFQFLLLASSLECFTKAFIAKESLLMLVVEANLLAES